MGRKKWTANDEVSDDLLKFREKRKWQMALRRYVLEKNSSEFYAPFFGLDIERFRKWIELQFSAQLNWGNFGKEWQFEHVIPISYFTSTEEEELKLCWNFINIKVGRVTQVSSDLHHVDLIAVKPYYEALYKATGNTQCLKMLNKINAICEKNERGEPLLVEFLITNHENIELLAMMSSYEFSRVNDGISLGDIFLEREILKKFG